jgi:hypothetical protein
MQAATTAAAILLLAAACLRRAAAVDGAWIEGRASFFDGNNQVGQAGCACGAARRGATAGLMFPPPRAPAHVARPASRRPPPPGPSPPQGSCGFGVNIPEFYAAWPDTLEGYASSCGACLEVACRAADFSDVYGEALQRSSGACYDEARIIVLKVVDT